MYDYDYNTAIKQIHFPDNFEMFRKARRRLVFDELLSMQLGLLRLKGENVSKKKGIKYSSDVKMSDIINEYNENNEEKATILTYDTLDYGLYYNTNTLPSTKYFCGLNIPLKEIGEEQNRLVENSIDSSSISLIEAIEEEFGSLSSMQYFV